MQGPTHYEVLGVDPRASCAEILAAFRRRAMHCHPDRNPAAGAHDAFAALTVAYRVLGDAGARAAYDRSAGLGGGTPRARGRTSTVAGAAPRPTAAKPGRDRHAPLNPLPPLRTVHATRDELAHGCRRVLDFGWIAPCESCAGTGTEADEGRGCRPCAGTGRSFATGYSAPCTACAGTGDPLPRRCVACGGTGRTPRREQVVVDVPAGCEEGACLTLREGRPDPLHPGERCDLTVRIALEPDNADSAAA